MVFTVESALARRAEEAGRRFPRQGSVRRARVQHDADRDRPRRADAWRSRRKARTRGSRSTPAAKAADTAKVEALLTALTQRPRDVVRRQDRRHRPRQARADRQRSRSRTARSTRRSRSAQGLRRLRPARGRCRRSEDRRRRPRRHRQGARRAEVADCHGHGIAQARRRQITVCGFVSCLRECRGCAVASPAARIRAPAVGPAKPTTDPNARWPRIWIGSSARPSHGTGPLGRRGTVARRPARVLYARNARKLMMPASNMKIVTLAAAAETLGWDYRFKTTLETSATIDDGVLKGDLIVRGGGDPTINSRDKRADRGVRRMGGGAESGRHHPHRRQRRRRRDRVRQPRARAGLVVGLPAGRIRRAVPARSSSTRTSRRCRSARREARRRCRARAVARHRARVDPPHGDR